MKPLYQPTYINLFRTFYEVYIKYCSQIEECMWGSNLSSPRNLTKLHIIGSNLYKSLPQHKSLTFPLTKNEKNGVIFHVTKTNMFLFIYMVYTLMSNHAKECTLSTKCFHMVGWKGLFLGLWSNSAHFNFLY